MKKIYVLDTSVLLDDPNAIYAFEDNEVVIPTVVLEEIDSKKRLGDDLGRNARRISRTLDKFREYGNLNKGIHLETGGTLRIEINHRNLKQVRHYFHEVNNDNLILAVALNLQLEEKEKESPKEVILVSKDILVRIKADTLGVAAQDYLSDKIVRFDDMYRGYEIINVPTLIIDKFYNDGFLDTTISPFNKYIFYPHQFLILKDELGSSKSAIVYYDSHMRKLFPLHSGDKAIWGIYPRNAQQKMALELLLDDNIPLVTLTGRAGTGKTLLALVAGLYKTEELSLYRKLLVARPVVPLGKDIGYLPGDKEEKLRPWMQPIYDNLEFIFNKHEGNDIEDIVAGIRGLEVEALTFIRGRSIPNEFIIIDEAQNLTKHEVKTIVSRVGENSKIVLVGDPEQIDHPYLDSTNNGLTYVIEKFKDYEEAGHVMFEKGERSRLAELAAKIL
ncbi:PhoH family protein [Caldisalinibacter kiritimatiensis]|uniref:Putative ATPase n=1 Tax=Caldisalinibacter kiritimatiensis TaxID=1304284 RepID=R1CLG3_9FIRM|nr:PhoH family protein [Caldisalinibacter kiritimatiensis]EOC99515.1 putative ATPase [Caldisalinibacter kiritimatiensis]